MEKEGIAGKIFVLEKNNGLKELFICADGHSYTTEGQALRHARETGSRFLGGITRHEWEEAVESGQPAEGQPKTGAESTPAPTEGSGKPTAENLKGKKQPKTANKDNKH